MYVCMYYVCMYVCMYVCVYVCVYVCTADVHFRAPVKKTCKLRLVICMASVCVVVEQCQSSPCVELQTREMCLTSCLKRLRRSWNQ